MTIENNSNVEGQGQGATSATATLTVPALLNNVVCVAVGYAADAEGDPGAGSATYDGNAMTQLFSYLTNTNHRTYGYIYKLGYNPSSGSKNVVMNVTASSNLVYVVASIFTGVHQSTANRTVVSGTSLTLGSITCSVDDMLVNIISTFSAGASSEPSTSTETLMKSTRVIDGFGYIGSAASYRLAASASETTVFTGTGTVQKHASIPLIPAPPATSTVVAVGTINVTGISILSVFTAPIKLFFKSRDYVLSFGHRSYSLFYKAKDYILSFKKRE